MRDECKTNGCQLGYLDAITGRAVAAEARVAELLPLAEAWASWLEENRDEMGHYRAAEAALIVERAKALADDLKRGRE